MHKESPTDRDQQVEPWRVPAPIALVLLSAPDCHLCEHARGVLSVLREETGLTWREVSAESPEGSSLARTAPPLRPVLFGPDGRVLACGRLSEKRLRRELAALVTDAARKATGG